MPIRVQVPGHGIVQFPDGTSPEDMKAALLKLPVTHSTVPVPHGDTNPLSDSAQPSMMDRVLESFRHIANPQDVSDFGAYIPGIGPVPGAGAIHAAAKVAPVVEATGRGASALGEAFGPASIPAAIADAVYRGSVPEAVGVAAGPTLLRGTGSILQRVGKFMRGPEASFSERPLFQQMERLPTEGKMPLGKPSGPPTNLELPSFPQKPVYQQVEELPTTSAPATVRAPGPVASGREAVTPPAPPRLAGKAPTLEDELVKAIQEAASKPEPGTLSTAAPALETAGEGALHQSGAFGKSGRLGQPGGYSSGRPGMTGEQYDDLITTPSNVPGRAVGAPEITPAAATPGGRPVAPETPASAAPPSAVQSAPAAAPTASSSSGDLTSQVLESLGETVPADQLTSSIERAQPVGPQQIEDARRYLGSRDAASNLGLTKDEVLRAAPGPSQRPMLLDDLQGGGDRSALIEKFLTDLLGK